MKTSASIHACAIVVALLAIGCGGGDNPGTDAGTGGHDAGGGADTGGTGTDTGVGTDGGTGTDAGVGTDGGAGTDAGTDAGSGDDTGVADDAGSDAGSASDAGSDAGSTPSGFCDVVYAFGGGDCTTPTETGRFHTIKTGLGGMNTYYDVGANCGSPHRGDGTTAVATPFTPTAFPRGYVRLRFPASGGAPAEGAVELIEYYMPVEFGVNTAGTMVTTDIDHSAGLLQTTTTGCPSGVTGCLGGVSDTMAPTLARSCTAVASGTLSGTTLTWDACPITPPAPYTTTTGMPSMAQQRWTPAMSQDTASSPGCMTNETSWGGISCTGTFCGAVPGLGAPTNLTWDQHLPNLTFSSTSYGATGTTLTLTEMIIPDEPTDVYSGTVITTATVVHVECGDLAALTCDDQ